MLKSLEDVVIFAVDDFVFINGMQALQQYRKCVGRKEDYIEK